MFRQTMENKIVFKHPARYFEEALPIGNGTMGAMVYGIPERERLSLNHDRLWTGGPHSYEPEGAYEAYKEAEALTLDGKYCEAQTLLEEKFTAPFCESYLPLGDLIVECDANDEISSYERVLDFDTATVKTTFKTGDNSVEREAFASNPDRAILLRLSSEKPISYRVSLACQLKHSIALENDLIRLTGVCPPKAYDMQDGYDGNATLPDYGDEGIHYTALLHVAANGETVADGDAFFVKNATEVVLIVTAETSFVSFDQLPNGEHESVCRDRIVTLSERSYDEIKSAHVSDFSAYYKRVELDLGFPGSDLETSKRLENRANDPGLVELLFNFSRYLLISGSRAGSHTMNLQGIWNENVFPAWQADLTVNINTEMNYWGAFACDLAECALPLVDTVKAVSVTGRRVASHYYHANGYCAHHNVDLWGHASPVGNHRSYCAGYAFWNVSAAWLCRTVYEYYLYTNDETYLRETAYPLMRGAAEFLLSVMHEEDGKWIITPATSPENGYRLPDGRFTAIAKYSVMNQTIAADLFANLLEASAILEIEDDLTETIRSRLPGLYAFRVGSDGQLLEYDREWEENDVHHRHVSHLYGLYPGAQITTETTPSLSAACRRTLERRGDESTGWSMGWKVCLFAKLKDGDHALKLIKDQLRLMEPGGEMFGGGGSYPNLFDAHPPFQIDGNFGVGAGIAMMFLQCENGKIKLLPALPGDFKNGSVKGLKAIGNIKVDLTWRDGKPESATLTSPVTREVAVVFDGETYSVRLTGGEPYRIGK